MLTLRNIAFHDILFLVSPIGGRLAPTAEVRRTLRHVDRPAPMADIERVGLR
jgi:hypothetical protein